MKVIAEQARKEAPTKQAAMRTEPAGLQGGINMALRMQKKPDEAYTIIIGCGRLGANLANTLSDESANVLIIDKNKDAFRKLAPSFGGLSLTGDALDLDVLQEVRSVSEHLCCCNKQRQCKYHVGADCPRIISCQARNASFMILKRNVFTVNLISIPSAPPFCPQRKSIKSCPRRPRRKMVFRRRINEN